MDVTFAAGACFALAALAIVALFVRPPARAEVELEAPEPAAAELEAVA
jgi:hypothetical protein